MTEEQKALPTHSHRPLFRVWWATLGLVVVAYLLSFYNGTVFTGTLFGFVISDVLIAAFVIALVWGIFVAISMREMCMMHITAVTQKYRAGIEWAVWGIALSLAWLTFMAILRAYIILNVLRFG